jgi:excisionase family DNA binding protein
MSGLPSVPVPAKAVFELWLEAHRASLARAFVPLDKRSGGFVDVEELADYTRLCVKTIRREIEDRNLPHHKVRGRLIIAVSDALAWLSARREV